MRYVLVLFLCACGVPAAGDGPNDSFLATSGSKADTAGIADGTPDAIGVLAVANQLDQATLDGAVGLDARAADNIVAYRLGDDGVAGSADDESFDTLKELDAVPYVGPVAFKKLLAYARANGYVPAPAPPPPPTSPPPVGSFSSTVAVSMPGYGIYCDQLGCTTRDLQLDFNLTVAGDGGGAITVSYQSVLGSAAETVDASGHFELFDPYTTYDGKGSISISGHLEADRVLVIEAYTDVFNWTDVDPGRVDTYKSSGPASVHY